MQPIHSWVLRASVSTVASQSAGSLYFSWGHGWWHKRVNNYFPKCDSGQADKAAEWVLLSGKCIILKGERAFHNGC